MFLDLESAAALASDSVRQDYAWWELKRMRRVLGDVTALGHGFGPDVRSPDYAFLAADAPAGARRTLVFLKRTAARPALLIAFDQNSKPASECWTIRGVEAAGEMLAGTARANGTEWRASGLAFLPRYGRALASSPRNTPEGARICSENSPEGPRLVAALQLRASGDAPAAVMEPVAEIDLVGVRASDWVALFHNGMSTNRSSVFFKARGGDKVRCLVTGLAPGGWRSRRR